MQAVQPFIQMLLLQAMALYIHGPLHCKDLLGRIPNPHSRPALATPQHAPGMRSDAGSQRTPPGESMHRSAAPHPATAPAGERPVPPARPRSDTQPPTLEALQHPQPHAIRPPDSTKARPTIKPDRLFLLYDGTRHRPQISQPEPPRPHRRASKARYSARHTARHFFASKAQIRHIPGILNPL